MSDAEYLPPVNQLLTLGDARGQSEWPNYLELGIGPEHIPALIRMATDESLNNADSESAEVWAPVHAFRALGQLHAAEAVEPLLGLLHRVDDFNDDAVGEELPEVFGLIGAPAIPALAAYLVDSRHGTFARVAAQESLANIAKQHPETRDQVAGALTRQLERFAENDRYLNGDLIHNLVELGATETAPLIEQAFAAGRVDEAVRGDWEDIQVDLGLKAARETPKRNYVLEQLMPSIEKALASGPSTGPTREEPSTRELRVEERRAPEQQVQVDERRTRANDRKAKSKRKQADKMRKRNRKRK